MWVFVRVLWLHVEGFFFFLLPCQHSEHKGRSKQRERDASNPGPLLLTAIVQRNSIMCANNVIIRYLEHNSVCKSISLHKCIISYSNEMFAKTTILGCCFLFVFLPWGFVKGWTGGFAFYLRHLILLLNMDGWEASEGSFWMRQLLLWW